MFPTDFCWGELDEPWSGVVPRQLYRQKPHPDKRCILIAIDFFFCVSWRRSAQEMNTRKCHKQLASK